ATLDQAAHAQAPPKDQNTLSNPTPFRARRPMTSDRVRVTQSPYTVDAGAWQLEIGFLDYTKENGDDDTWRWAPANVKLGINNSMDAQFRWVPYVYGADDDGIGDMELRLKWNAWGNDGDKKTSLAIIPFVLAPTASDELGAEKWEGGVLIPLEFRVSPTLDFGLQVGAEGRYDDVEDRHNLEVPHSAFLNYHLNYEWGVYGEFFGVWNSDTTIQYQAGLGFGTTYELTNDAMLDLGFQVNVEGDGDDFRFFTGITLRF
ncbi:MAG: transporter, partial [Planctomycetota bacterium]